MKNTEPATSANAYSYCINCVDADFSFSTCCLNRQLYKIHHVAYYDVDLKLTDKLVAMCKLHGCKSIIR